MSSFLGAVNDLASGRFAKGARSVAGVAAWAGHAVSRQVKSGLRGVCLVCNNLQPYGHEDTFGRAGARWHSGETSLAPPSSSDSVVPTLVLEKISTKKILESREIDEKTGHPKNDCRYCRLLCAIFDSFFVDEWMSWITETKNAMPIDVGLMIREGAPLIINCRGFTYERDVYMPRVDLEVYTETAPNFDMFLAGAPSMGQVGARAETAASEACIRFMKDCVTQCCSEHPLCNPPATNFVPTRLIYLGESNDDLRLHDTIPATLGVKWAALSHCWGGGQPFKLEPANLQLLKKHINYSDLPATFANAIDVARNLGLLYLWIDSLCILQGDKNDWEIEAARMGMVYGQAFVVICAASSPNSETPFLGPRDEEWLPKRFEFETEKDGKIPLMVRRRHILAAPLEQGLLEPPFTSAWSYLRRAGPLYERGWCFQETFLATRVIHFSPGAVIFECKTHRRSEDQLPPYPSTIMGTLGETDVATQWHMIVKAYTQRKLTFPSDKLPAIGGAASKMPQAPFTTYLAGLWQESLLLDLLWQAMPGGTHKVLTYSRTEPIAPSWSWASLNFAVTWNELKSPQILAEVVSASVSVVGANPYGQVSSGRISIRGRMRPCFISTSRQKNEQWVHYIKKDGSQSKKIHFRADGQLMVEEKDGKVGGTARRGYGSDYAEDVFAAANFLCIAKTSWTNYNYVGIILGASPSVEGVMERVGNITNVPSDWYEGGEMWTVDIV